ncbi:hypothetical protein BLOT_009246 [Blomia tropicalis]|nr:hypothetical protein BLOT_009246 [Blomia tropicalis]
MRMIQISKTQMIDELFDEVLLAKSFFQNSNEANYSEKCVYPHIPYTFRMQSKCRQLHHQPIRNPFEETGAEQIVNELIDQIGLNDRLGQQCNVCDGVHNFKGLFCVRSSIIK